MDVNPNDISVTIILGDLRLFKNSGIYYNEAGCCVSAR